MIDPATAQLVINTNTSITKLFLLTAFINSGPAVAYVGLTVEICGLEIIFANTSNEMYYWYDKNPVKDSVARYPAVDYTQHFRIVGSNVCLISGYAIYT